MKTLKLLITQIVIFIFLFCQNNYLFSQEIKIGAQTWATRNLNVNTFVNGDPIPQAQGVEEWKKALAEKKPAWCFFNNDSAGSKLNGRLYNCFAVQDSRGLAPKGWHIPNDEEWTKLTDALGGIEVAGPKLKEIDVWKSGISNNSSGFMGLPAGYRAGTGEFYELGTAANWWSSTSYYGMSGMCYMRSLDSEGTIYKIPNGGRSGLSIRCVKD